MESCKIANKMDVTTSVTAIAKDKNQLIQK